MIGVDALNIGLVHYKHLSKDSNVHLIQADLSQLPFKENSSDLIYNLGILHHTPNPPAFFKNLVRYLKKDGTIAIWVYPKRPFFLSDWIRPLTIRLPLKLLGWIGLIVSAFCGLLLKVPSTCLRNILEGMDVS